MLPIIIAIVGGVLALGLVAFGIIASRNQPSVVQERLGRYTDATVKVAAPVPTVAKPRQSPLGERLNEALRNRSFFGKVQSTLNSADLKINVGEYSVLLLMGCLGGVVIGVLLSVISDCTSRGGAILSCLINRGPADIAYALAGGGIGLYAPMFYVNHRKSQRIKAFDGQLGDTLNLLVNALRSGYSVLQAMEAVARELPPPMSVEFRRVVQEIQLGLPMETALDHLLDRISSEDLDLVITAINIQREVGGNLAEILDVISHTIRERIRIKGEIAVLTSQGIATGWAITLMPVALMGILSLVNRPYIGEFFIAKNQPCGWGLLIISLIMILLGGAIIRKIVSIEV
ncbi:MAG: secretion system protein [Chloroflexi bacterium]|nr:secretion system protein [Chloroflexota bacterium]